jgi:hypothetical protein
MGSDSQSEAAQISREPLNAANYFPGTNIPERKKAALLSQRGFKIVLSFKSAGLTGSRQ